MSQLEWRLLLLVGRTKKCDCTHQVSSRARVSARIAHLPRVIDYKATQRGRESREGRPTIG